MTLSIEFFNNQVKEHYKQKFSFDDYEVALDYLSNEYITKLIDNRAVVFPPLLIRWKKDGKKFSTLIPPLLRAKVIGAWPFKYESWEYDDEKIEQYFKDLLKRKVQ